MSTSIPTARYSWSKSWQESRTSKMFKRMSNMSGRPWKNSNNSLAVQPELNPINRSPIYLRV
jgi:hypothetical protein